MIYEFYLNGKDKGLKMSDEAARLLYAGIVGDTGRFLFPSTSEKTFAYAGELIHYQFSRTEIYEGMYNLSPNIVKLNGYILAKLCNRRTRYCLYEINVGNASEV